MKTAIRLSVLCLVAFALMGAPDRVWQTGTVVEETQAREIARGTPLAFATGGGYVLRGQGTEYTVALPVLPSAPPADASRPSVTIHGPIKYCYDKGRFYIEDEAGQEFEMTVLRKEALPAAAAPRHPRRHWWVPWPIW